LGRQAFAEQVDNNASEQRERKIEKICAKAMLRMRNMRMAVVFEAWQINTGHRATVLTKARKAIRLMQNITVANAFLPWIAAARSSQLAKFQALETRALDMDLRMARHHEDSATLSASIVQELDQLRSDHDELRNTGRLQEKSEHRPYTPEALAAVVLQLAERKKEDADVVKREADAQVRAPAGVPPYGTILSS
jgi:hypothetical protein